MGSRQDSLFGIFPNCWDITPPPLAWIQCGGLQRQKYLASARAMLSGKFLRVRKVFEIKTYFWPTTLYLRICLLFFPECLEEFLFFLVIIFFTALEPSRLLGRFPENLDWFQTNTPKSVQLLLSGNFTECLEGFAQYGLLPDKIKIFQAVRNALRLFYRISRLSGNFPDCIETCWIFWRISRLSGNFQGYFETW